MAHTLITHKRSYLGSPRTPHLRSFLTPNRVSGEESRPQDTNLVGTPHYMSPELLSCKAYGFKTDVW